MLWKNHITGALNLLSNISVYIYNQSIHNASVYNLTATIVSKTIAYYTVLHKLLFFQFSLHLWHYIDFFLIYMDYTSLSILIHCDLGYTVNYLLQKSLTILKPSVLESTPISLFRQAEPGHTTSNSLSPLSLPLRPFPTPPFPRTHRQGVMGMLHNSLRQHNPHRSTLPSTSE